VTVRARTLLDAPSNLGLEPPAPGVEPGTAKAPAALRRAGLRFALDAAEGGVVTPPAYSHESGATRIRNARAIATYSRALADRIGDLLDRDTFPIVVGGDCSILLGAGLALRRRGRYGLAFVDGHRDLATPETSTTGGVAGMDLALATGTGPAALADLDGLSPLFRPEDVVVVGHRDGADTGGPAPTGMVLRALDSLDRTSLAREGAAVAAALEECETEGFWIHVDVDVLDSRLMPAVDSPQNGGLGFEELAELLHPLLGSSRASGVELTIFDPDRDPGRFHALHLVAALADAFH
jgi:arginase